MTDSYTGSNTSRTRFFTEKTHRLAIMKSCSTDDSTQEICWFCKKGRHEECMVQMPVDGRSEGPHDCAFDTKLIPCKCTH